MPSAGWSGLSGSRVCTRSARRWCYVVGESFGWPWDTSRVALPRSWWYGTQRSWPHFARIGISLGWEQYHSSQLFQEIYDAPPVGAYVIIVQERVVYALHKFGYSSHDEVVAVCVGVPAGQETHRFPAVSIPALSCEEDSFVLVTNPCIHHSFHLVPWDGACLLGGGGGGGTV